MSYTVTLVRVFSLTEIQRCIDVMGYPEVRKSTQKRRLEFLGAALMTKHCDVAPSKLEYIGGRTDRTWQATFCFSTLEDATLFKLRWGGA
jgi:hypothetical protein